MFFKGKHEAARMELRFINKTGNRHFDKPSYIYMWTHVYICIYIYIRVFMYNIFMYTYLYSLLFAAKKPDGVFRESSCRLPLETSIACEP